MLVLPSLYRAVNVHNLGMETVLHSLGNSRSHRGPLVVYVWWQEQLRYIYIHVENLTSYYWYELKQNVRTRSIVGYTVKCI